MKSMLSSSCCPKVIEKQHAGGRDPTPKFRTYIPRSSPMPQALRSVVHEKQRICDPITLEIVRGVLTATMQEMNALIERTSMSPFIREKKDFHSGIYDGN